MDHKRLQPEVTSRGRERSPPERQYPEPPNHSPTITSGGFTAFGRKESRIVDPGPQYSIPGYIPPPPAPPTGAIGSPLSQHTFDPTGQISPPEMDDRVMPKLWAYDGCFLFQVEARGTGVDRRLDNDMVNGTKLLKVSGVTRGRRDALLGRERVRDVVTYGPMQLKGVWIPLERALALANQENITDLLFPLFLENIGFFPHLSDQSRLNQSQIDPILVTADQSCVGGGQAPARE